MITFVRFQGELFKRFEASCTQLLYFGGEDSFGSGRAVYTVRLDGDNNTTANL